MTRSSSPGRAKGRGTQARDTAAKKRSKAVAKAKPVAVAEASDRRTPTQARSQRRFESIVQSAAESFAQFGFSDTTMEGIAARAGTSIGSVYQFFPNKHAVFRELARRSMQMARDNYAALLGPDPLSQRWDVMLDRFIDGFRRLNDDNIHMRAIWRNLELYAEYAEEDQALMRELVEATAMLFGGWLPKLDADKRKVVATMLVNTVAAMMLVLAREGDDGRGEAIMEETKLMLKRYLAVYLGDAG